MVYIKETSSHTCFDNLTFCFLLPSLLVFGYLNPYFQLLLFIIFSKFPISTVVTAFLVLDLFPKDPSTWWTLASSFFRSCSWQGYRQPSRHMIGKFLKEFLRKQINSTVFWKRTIAINSRLSFLAAPRVQFLCMAERSKFHWLLIRDIPVAQLTFC